MNHNLDSMPQGEREHALEALLDVVERFLVERPNEEQRALTLLDAVEQYHHRGIMDLSNRLRRVLELGCGQDVDKLAWWRRRHAADRR